MQSLKRRPHRTIIMENRKNMNFQVFFFIEDFFLPSTKLISSITCHRTAVEKAGFKGNRNKKDKRQKTRAVSPNKNTKAIFVLGRSETENTMVRKYRYSLMQRSDSDSCFCLEPINLTKKCDFTAFYDYYDYDWL